VDPRRDGLPSRRAARAACPPLQHDRGSTAFGRRLRDSGIGLHVLEPFLIMPSITLEMHRRNLDLAVELGAKVCGTLAFDPDEERRTSRLAELAEDAGERGLKLTIEPYLESDWPTFLSAVAAAEGAGENAGVTLDVLHVIRGGRAGTQWRRLIRPRSSPSS